MPASRKALALKVNEIETDSRVTRDGIVVQIHDENLERLTDRRLVVAESTYAELKAVKPDITTLEEMIRLINRRFPATLQESFDYLYDLVGWFVRLYFDAQRNTTVN